MRGVVGWQRQFEGTSGDGFLGIDPMLLIHCGKQFRVCPNCFRRTEEKKAVRPKGIVKCRDNLRMQRRLEIDQQIAATDQVHS